VMPLRSGPGWAPAGFNLQSMKPNRVDLTFGQLLIHLTRHSCAPNWTCLRAGNSMRLCAVSDMSMRETQAGQYQVLVSATNEFDLP